MSLDTSRLDPPTVRELLRDHRPEVRRGCGGWQAATALIVTPAPDRKGVELAFIRRTERDDDYWSGQMALPGGTLDEQDKDLAATAAREAYEEVGVRLPPPTGRLDDQRGRRVRIVVASFVFVLDEQPTLHPDSTEVARAMWIGLDHLLDPAATTELRWAGMCFPGIAHDGEVIWGLTHRILGTLAAALGTRLPLS